MATLTVSAAGVLKGASTTVVDPSGTSGEAIPIGCVVTRKTDGLWYKASNATAILAAASGVAMSACSAAQQPIAVSKGLITFTGTTTITVGASYSLGTAGALVDDADVGSGAFKTFCALGITSSSLLVSPLASGVAVA